MRGMHMASRVLVFWLGLTLAFAAENSPTPATTAATAAVAPTVVIGFVGGFVRHDNALHSTIQVAARLRKRLPPGAYVGVFENHRRHEAYKEILRQLNLNHDGMLSAEEKQNARIIIYGHSWGASETVTLARQLERVGIPVLLTIQVDSVAKIGQNDAVIPANVEQAVNFYQPNGLVHGRAEIRAADPSRTEIVGNFRFDYRQNPIRCEGYPWFNRVFIRAHTEIECDPVVWDQVESLIHSRLSAEPRELAAR